MPVVEGKYKPWSMKEWFTFARENSEKLICLLKAYHPRSGAPRMDLPITARGAENACEGIREDIKKESDEDPIEAFKKALEAEDYNKVCSLLNGAWFGVPESNLCWQITGFSEAVDLLDDPPEEEDGDYEDDKDRN